VSHSSLQCRDAGGPHALLGAERNLHLFDREKLVFTPGDLGLNVFGTPSGKIGLCICYDPCFVDVVRVLARVNAAVEKYGVGSRP
jgi:predicted amidohydrolase